MAMRYAVGQTLAQVAKLLNISPERILRRAGLSATLVENEDLSVSADAFFRIWEAIRMEADRPDLEMKLAMAYAHGPFLPPIFAFSCADTLERGLGRLADFKPLIGPVSLDVTRSESHVRVELRAADQSLTMPPTLGLFEVLYLTECARTFSGVPITPAEITLSAPRPMDCPSIDYLGRIPKCTGAVSLTFTAEDGPPPPCHPQCVALGNA